MHVPEERQYANGHVQHLLTCTCTLCNSSLSQAYDYSLSSAPADPTSPYVQELDTLTLKSIAEEASAY